MGTRNASLTFLFFSLKKDCRSISNSIVFLEFCRPVRLLERWMGILHNQRATMRWLAGGMLFTCISVHSPSHSLYSLPREVGIVSREWKVKVLVAQYCPTPWDTVDCSPTGSSVHGILHTRTLKWVAILFTRDLPDPGIKPGSLALQADSWSSEPPGNWHVSSSYCVPTTVIANMYKILFNSQNNHIRWKYFFTINCWEPWKILKHLC